MSIEPLHTKNGSFYEIFDTRVLHLLIAMHHAIRKHHRKHLLKKIL